MEIIKKYFKNLGWILIASILYVVSMIIVTVTINIDTEEMLSIITRLIDIFLITIVNIIIIKKVAGKADKKIDLETYLSAFAVTILFSYDEMIKFSNSKGFLLATI